MRKLTTCQQYLDEIFERLELVSIRANSFPNYTSFLNSLEICAAYGKISELRAVLNELNRILKSERIV